MRPSSRLALTLLVVSCVRTTPQPPPQPPPPALDVPPGCLAPLSGPWVHAADPSYRYEGADDGGALTLLAFRELVVDAGFKPRRFRRDAGVDDAGPAPDAGEDDGASLDGGDAPAPTRVELVRSATGFAGQTVASVLLPSGQRCEARFPTRVLSCADGGLRIETQSSTALGEACQPPAQPQGQLVQVHQLVRPDAG